MDRVCILPVFLLIKGCVFIHGIVPFLRRFLMRRYMKRAAGRLLEEQNIKNKANLYFHHLEIVMSIAIFGYIQWPDKKLGH